MSDSETERDDLHAGKLYRIRPLISPATKGEKMHGIELEGTGNLAKWLVISYDPDKTPERQIIAFRRQFKAAMPDQEMMMIPNDWELCVFEAVE